jgi:alkylation response protein AidB-like acyl-CoA dehydrogenase
MGQRASDTRALIFEDVVVPKEVSIMKLSALEQYHQGSRYIISECVGR